MAFTTTSPSPLAAPAPLPSTRLPSRGTTVRNAIAACLSVPRRPRVKATSTADTIEHAQLVAAVRTRSAELGVDVPIRAFGEQPKIVFHEPSGISRHLYPDEASLEIAISQRLTSRSIAEVGTHGPTISDWSVERLQRWLADHEDATAERQARPRAATTGAKSRIADAPTVTYEMP